MKIKLKKEQFLPAITTTSGADWRAMIQEIDELDLEKIAIFPTCLAELEQRKEFFELLEKTSLKEIPFVHIRSNMRPEELAYLTKRWHTKVFNTHSEDEFPLEYDLSDYFDRMYIENTYWPFNPREMEKFAGLCLDFSHLENHRLLAPSKYKHNIEMLEKFPVGCNHISAIKPRPHQDNNGDPIYSIHQFEDLSEFDYLKSYPQEWFSDYIAMELENSLSEQLKAIDYILKIKN